MTRATNATERVVEISGYLCGARLSTSNTATASSSEVTVAIAPLPSSRDNSSLKRSCLTSIFAISYGLAITTCCGEGFENSIEKCPLWRDRCYTMPPYSMLHTVHCSTPYSTEIWDWIRRPLGIEIRFHAAAAESDCSSDQSHVTRSRQYWRPLGQSRGQVDSETGCTDFLRRIVGQRFVFVGPDLPPLIGPSH
jgi:hypothetical protein